MIGWYQSYHNRHVQKVFLIIFLLLLCYKNHISMLHDFGYYFWILLNGYFGKQ